jgi:hypothetical protein
MRLPPLILALALASCDKPAPPPEDPPPDIPALPDLALPDVPEVERHDTAPPASTSPLRWDFDDARVHGYKLVHESWTTRVGRYRGPTLEAYHKQRYQMGRVAQEKKWKDEGRPDADIARDLAAEDAKFAAWLANPEDKSASHARYDGYVDLKGAGGGIARVEYKLALREEIVDGVKQDVNKAPPGMFTAQMEETGTLLDVKVARGEPDTFFFELYFALPARPLAVGESSERAINVLALGDRLGQKGSARTTLAGFAQVEGRECARLVTDVDLAIEFAAPAEGHGRKRARIVAYFDLRARRFLRIDAAVALAMRTRAHIAHGTGPKLWSLASLDVLTRFSARHGS